MAKILTVAAIFPLLTLFLFGGFFAVPVDAQTEGPKESCRLVDDLKIRISFPTISGFVATHSIKEGSAISSQIKDADNVKALLVSGNGVVNESFSDVYLNPTIKNAIEAKWGLICLFNTINSVTGWIFFVLIAVSFVMILLAGFMWVTAGTNPENQKKAGQMIVAALVGITIALLSRIIPSIVTGVLA